MPPFQAPVANGKRRFDDENARPGDAKRPRVATDGPQSTANESGLDEYWMVQWRNHQAKKHKTWEGDAVLVVLNSNSKATLYDATDGKSIGNGKAELPLFDGKLLHVGGKDVELDRKITSQEFLSGICFGSSSAFNRQSISAPPIHRPTKGFKPLTLRKPASGDAPQTPAPLSTTRQPQPSPPQATRELKQMDKSGLAPSSYWVVNWRKSQSSNKKQITWEGDAFISCIDYKITMISEEGKIMGTSTCKDQILQTGNKYNVGGKEIVLLDQVESSVLPSTESTSSQVNEPETPAPEIASPAPAPAPAPSNRYIAPASFYAAPVHAKKPPGPKHDPEAEGAIVMKGPTKEHLERYNKRDRPVVPVVVDPILARNMRPHQCEGVKFMYECIMGLRKHEGQGCILADEMGLGKTLQTISLIWTVLRQNPYYGAGPIASKVLIVCPVSLINNWKAEFHKWLGRDRVGISVCDKNANAAKTFASSPSQKVLIVGYERLRNVMKEISTCGVGLIVCDEGHRLKSAKAKTSTIFKQLNTPRRIILSGTPIQNDLGEFHSMVDFCNPGLLDEYTTFRRVYETPILKSRAPGCTAEELELGKRRSTQLTNVAQSFVLRREATILNNYLPPKHEYVVFITPTQLQLNIFAKVLDPNKVDDFVESSSTAESLALINILTKISSSPILLKAAADKERSSSSGSSLRRNNIQDAAELIPSNSQIEDLSLSGKMLFLSKLLAAIKQESDEKCVLVSHYTSTLNIVESFCKKMKYSYFRLDGQTPAAKRQEYVNTFNKTNQKSSFILLLSSKAGGTGINLIGASRLCLIDSDWNPSHDLQAMARCHRDGQKRPVHIYRLLTAGTIDEKIYQRQIIKLGLSNSLMGSETSKSKSTADSFTRKDLRDIFRVNLNTSSNTHDLLECICEDPGAEHDSPLDQPDEETDDESEVPKGFVSASQVKPQQTNKVDREYLEKKRASLAALGEWKHINCLKPDAGKNVKDNLLRRILYVKPKRPSPNVGSKMDQILAAVDLDSLSEMEPPTAATVPGGTVSFLFERSCSIAEQPDEDAEEEGQEEQEEQEGEEDSS